MRTLIFFTLCLFVPISFACDASYEQIGDYKIGCPFVDDKNEFQYIDALHVGGKEVKGYAKKVINNDLFSEENIIVIDGNIEAVLLILKDEISLGFIESLINRWGSPVSNNSVAGNLLGVNDQILLFTPSDSVISSIKVDILSIFYVSRKFAKIGLDEEMKGDYSKY